MKTRDHNLLINGLLLLALSLWLLSGIGCASAPASIQTRVPFRDQLVTGNSMLPLIPIGTHYTVFPADYDSLQPGQLVAYVPYFARPKGAYYVHQLQVKRGDYWVVKGINNAKADDSFMTRENFIGIVKL